MKTNEKITLMLVDDHFVVRAGLTGSLMMDPAVTVVAECDSGEEAIKAYRKHRPQVVLMDWRLPGMSGVETTKQIRGEFPEARIVVLSAYEGDEDIHRAVEAGVSGYLPKTIRRKELLQAIRTVHGGDTYFPATITIKLAERQNRPTLNEKEMSVLTCIAHGRSNKEIAADLGMAEVTVKFHVGHILKKLNAADRTQAATVAFQRGILHLE